MGNQINNADPWTNTLEKITRSLKQWNKGHPTLKGRQLIIQMIVGGMTQFLTKAQGEMPPDIESKIIKMMRAFIWNSDTTPSINMCTLSLPQAEGGINLLDLKARNKAIQATWLQEYLKFNELRPAWAYIADEIINTQLAGRHTDKQARINMFLQQWSVNPNTTSKLPRDLTNMLQIGHELKVDFTAIDPEKNTKENLPIWHHIGANNALLELSSKREAKCLRHKHRIRTVQEMNMVAGMENVHKPRRNCRCDMCQIIRGESRCKNPHKCC
jgi:hypothetical protein